MAAARGKGKGGIQVLRIETKARIGSGLVAHISGAHRPDTVHEVPAGEAAFVELVADQVKARMALERHWLVERRRGAKRGVRHTKASSSCSRVRVSTGAVTSGTGSLRSGLSVSAWTGFATPWGRSR